MAPSTDAKPVIQYCAPNVYTYKETYSNVYIYKETHPNVYTYKETHPNVYTYKETHPNVYIYKETHPNVYIYKETHPNVYTYKETHPNVYTYKETHPNDDIVSVLIAINNSIILFDRNSGCDIAIWTSFGALSMKMSLKVNVKVTHTSAGYPRMRMEDVNETVMDTAAGISFMLPLPCTYSSTVFCLFPQNEGYKPGREQQQLDKTNRHFSSDYNTK